MKSKILKWEKVYQQLSPQYSSTHGKLGARQKVKRIFYKSSLSLNWDRLNETVWLMEQSVDQTRARLERVNEETLQLKHELLKARNENVVLKCQLKDELKKNSKLAKVLQKQKLSLKSKIYSFWKL